jgi:iron complex transport system ATP-binding protein
MLQTQQLCVSLGGRPVLHQVDCALSPGEVVGLIGPNGSGKSTLLKALAGLLPPESGEVLLDGVPMRKITPRERARRLAYLPQGAECHWPLTVERVVELGRLPFDGGETAADALHVEKALHAVDALALRDRVITELSGGERARVFLARALASDPALLLVDEPGAGLDPYHQLQMMELLAARVQEDRAVLVVLHDLGLAARFCHRLLLLKDGRLLAFGTPQEVLSEKMLAEAHGIRAYRAHYEDTSVVMPWERLSPTRPEGQ